LPISITKGEAWQVDVCTSSILSFPLCCANTISPVIRAPLVGEAQRKKKICEISKMALQICHASPIGKAKAPPFAL
jgi:hypothetical protein